MANNYDEGNNLPGRVVGNALSPFPRHNDNVERVDMSRMFGRVTSIRKNGSFWVEWKDGEKPKKSIETGKTVALTRRV